MTLITEAEAAEALKVSTRTLRNLRKAGIIPYVRPSPRKVFYTAEDVATYIERQRRQECPPCPSTNQKAARTGIMTSKSQGSGIMAQLAARPNGMPSALKLIAGGKRS